MSDKQDKQTKSRSIKELGMMLWEEVRLDILAEADGAPRPAGEMQNDYPKEYRAMRELLPEIALQMGMAYVKFSQSFKQAEQLSEMLHSEDEGLNSIQEALNKQPVNALTLAALIRLERERGAGNLEEKVSKALAQYHRGVTRRANEASHAKHRDDSENIRREWASGKYKSRDDCADKTSIAFSVSRKKARNALLNTPDPTPWPAKPKRSSYPPA